MSFWNTILSPHIGGDPWALAILCLAQGWLAFVFYRKNSIRWAMFMSACFAANMVRLIGK